MTKQSEERWTVSICRLHNAPLFQAHNGCDCKPEHTMMARRIEVVPATDLEQERARAEELERELNSEEEIDAALLEQQRARAEAAEASRDRYKDALQEIADYEAYVSEWTQPASEMQTIAERALSNPSEEER